MVGWELPTDSDWTDGTQDRTDSADTDRAYGTHYRTDPADPDRSYGTEDRIGTHDRRDVRHADERDRVPDPTDGAVSEIRRAA